MEYPRKSTRLPDQMGYPRNQENDVADWTEEYAISNQHATTRICDVLIDDKEYFQVIVDAHDRLEKKLLPLCRALSWTRISRFTKLKTGTPHTSFSRVLCTFVYTTSWVKVSQVRSRSIHMSSMMSHVGACVVCSRFVFFLFLSHFYLSLSLSTCSLSYGRCRQEDRTRVFSHAPCTCDHTTFGSSCLKCAVTPSTCHP